MNEPSRESLFWYDFQQRLPEIELAVCARAASAVLTVASILLSAQVALSTRKSWTAPLGIVVLLDLVAA